MTYPKLFRVDYSWVFGSKFPHLEYNLHAMAVKGETLTLSRELDGEIRDFPCNPNLLIRLNQDPGEDYRESLRNGIEIQRNVFGKLRSCGIAIPTFLSVVGPSFHKDLPDEETFEIHTFVRRVNGANLGKVPSVISQTEQFRTEVNRTLNGLVRFYKGSSEDDWFPNDIFDPSQWMYGKTKKDNMDRLYLIDIEPVFEKLTKSSQYGYLSGFTTLLQRNYGIDGRVVFENR